ncbi:hypothetical protein KSP39_PZI008238 [Platanthera zijinensis]|uniref:C2 domain-containing protein n=1 Tax=Platanthera zijinensis TaxID=2320716 RepID=A0AAP0BNF5_9ASPA
MTHGGHVAGTDPRQHLHHRHHHLLQPPPPPPLSTPFHLLEITIISAQDLNATCGRTRAYAQAWVDPNYKLETRIDRIGRTNPSWNDKFIFRVDDGYLRSDTAALTVAIKRASQVGRIRPDPIIGTARLIVSTVNPSPEIQLVALQVRRPKSLRPQGILNLGVALRSDFEAAREMVFDRTVSPRGRWEKSGEVGRWVVEKEREALQLKLEKWRSEISPAVVDPHQTIPAPEKKRDTNKIGGRLFGCFSSHGTRWD